MKIIKLQNSVLLMRINLKTDTIEARFYFFTSFLQTKRLRQDFNINDLNASQVVTFFKHLANDWTTKYLLK